MIIRLSQDQKEIAVTIVEPGCQGRQVLDYTQFRLVIQRPGDCECWLNHSPILRLGCWPGMPEWVDPAFRVSSPILVYPAFDTDDSGNIVFRLDDKIFSYLPGRYWGDVERTNGVGWYPVRRLDIDLENTPALVSRIIVSGSDVAPSVCS